ncbi:acyl-CoA thioesterase [Rhizorhabdus sp. FW153]|uniref:acyl-CoA thioesterase n=1 Tax=Rhizorhabdus sp. FW153 TaxID=3400216 RepID=UPI003CED9C04
MTNLQDLSFEQFPFRTFDKLRYSDTDRQGHVNNAVFSTFLETGRVEFLYDAVRPLLAAQAAFVIANLNLQFVSEIRWPGQVDIGTAVLRVGTSSLGLYQGLFQEGRRVASAETVIVQMDEQTRKSCPLSQDARDFLSRHLITAD